MVLAVTDQNCILRWFFGDFPIANSGNQPEPSYDQKSVAAFSCNY
jgi:hypothetical protein